MTTTRDIRNPLSAEVLHENALSPIPGTARRAENLLRLRTRDLRSIACQEWTYRLNTEPGWRPSDLLSQIVDRLLDRGTDSLCSPSARSMAGHI